MKKKNFLFLLCIIFSLLMHLLLPTVDNEFVVSSKAQKPILPIEVAQMTGAGTGANKKGVRGSSPNNSMKDLMPTLKELGASRALVPGMGGSSHPGQGTRSGEGTGLDGGWITSVGADKFMPLMPYLQVVWNHIDKNLFFPKEFSDRGISGKVHVRLILNPDGTLTENFQRVDSDSDYLEAYVLALLLSIFETPLVKREHQPNTRIALNMTFHFELETESVFADQSKGETLPQALLFKRVAIVPSVIDKVFNELFTSYFPPILILGPVAYIDVIRAYQFIHNYGKPTEKVLEKTRLEYLTQKLKATISKKSK